MTSGVYVLSATAGSADVDLTDTSDLGGGFIFDSLINMAVKGIRQIGHDLVFSLADNIARRLSKYMISGSDPTMSSPGMFHAAFKA